MTGFLTDAGLHAEVDKVDVVHYLSCLDQEEAKHRYEDLHIVPCDIVHTNPKALPQCIKLEIPIMTVMFSLSFLLVGRIYMVFITNREITTIH